MYSVRLTPIGYWKYLKILSCTALQYIYWKPTYFCSYQLAWFLIAYFPYDCEGFRKFKENRAHVKHKSYSSNHHQNSYSRNIRKPQKLYQATQMITNPFHDVISHCEWIILKENCSYCFFSNLASSILCQFFLFSFVFSLFSFSLCNFLCPYFWLCLCITCKIQFK